MKAKYISYQDTHSFSKLVLDYVNDDEFLKSFYSFRPDIDGLKKSVDSRDFKGNRAELVEVLNQQYQNVKTNKGRKQSLAIFIFFIYCLILSLNSSGIVDVAF